MSTAAVGLRPKMVVRSLMAERGSAEPPSSRRSVLTLPLALPLAPLDRSVLTDPEPVAVPLAFPDGGVVTEDEPDAVPDGGVVEVEGVGGHGGPGNYRGSSASFSRARSTISRSPP